MPSNNPRPTCTAASAWGCPVHAPKHMEAAKPTVAHVANEWADAATNGLQWLRNVAIGATDVVTAIAAMESDIAHCKEVSAAAKPTGPLYDRILAALQAGPMVGNVEWRARQIAELVGGETRQVRDERDALAAAGLCWQPIATFAAMKRFYSGESVLLLPKNSEFPVFLKVLPEEWSYDFKDREQTYFKAQVFDYWMPRQAHPESEMAKSLGAILAARDSRLKAEGRREGLEEAADILEFVASSTFHVCEDEWTTCEPDHDDEREWTDISAQARALLANDKLAAQAGEVANAD